MTSGNYNASTREWTTVIPQVSSSPDPGIWVTQPRKKKMAFKEKVRTTYRKSPTGADLDKIFFYRGLRARVCRKLLMCWFIQAENRRDSGRSMRAAGRGRVLVFAGSYTVVVDDMCAERTFLDVTWSLKPYVMLNYL